MRKRMISAGLAATALAAVAAAVAAGAFSSPAHAVAVSAAKAKPKVCMPVDGPTVFDKSFVQTTWLGVQRAEKKLGVTGKYVTGQETVDINPNMMALIHQNCSLIVPVGYTWGDETKKVAKKFPKQKFAIIDYSYPKPIPNVRELTFQTNQAAFLTGYLAAGMTKTGKLGVYGGVNTSVVTIYMDGFEAGMNYYNAKHHANVQMLGWNAKKKTGLFTGDFVNQDNGRRDTETLLQQGADIIMPVAGGVGLGTLAALKAAGHGYAIWVDTDGCISAPQYCNLILSSAEKRMDVATYDTIRDLVHGKWKGGLYVGTLKNNGVGMAPYHKLASKVPASLTREINQAKRAIIAGKINVEAWAKK